MDPRIRIHIQTKMLWIRNTANNYKDTNPKGRLYLCLIEVIDRRYSQSCWYFRPLLCTSAPLTFSLVNFKKSRHLGRGVFINIWPCNFVYNCCGNLETNCYEIAEILTFSDILCVIIANNTLKWLSSWKCVNTWLEKLKLLIAYVHFLSVRILIIFVLVIGHQTFIRRNKSLLKGWKSGLCILVNFLVSGSGSAFPIWIQIQNSQISADLDSQQCLNVNINFAYSFSVGSGSRTGSDRHQNRKS